jgi:hypothetical protein
VRSFDNELVEGQKKRPYSGQQSVKRRLLADFVSWSPLAFGFAMLSLASIASAQTSTTFRGHTLGESWQTFIRTEGGLCHLSEANAEACKQAAAGKKAVLIQRSKENHASAHFSFEAGRFVSATGFMGGPKFAELTFLEKTYGKPSIKNSDPEKGEAVSLWDFSDGGKVKATETTNDSSGATIKVSVSAKATSKTPVAGPNADDVCSFIVGKIRQAVPDVPTMCHVKETSSRHSYDVTVFSTVDVLQGKLRRPWSTALFDATQDLFYGNALGGVCHRSSTWTTDEGMWCTVSFSDSEMARSWGRHYSVISLPEMEKGLYGDPSSDDWYRNWWGMSGPETFDHGGSKEHATWAGKKACGMYEDAIRDAIRQDQLYSVKPAGMTIPTCTVFVATDSFVYIQIDNDGLFSDYISPLPMTFGKAFSDLPYDGTVTFKGAWHESKEGPGRFVRSWELPDLKFLYDEVHSGSRTESEASVSAHGEQSWSLKYAINEKASLGWVVNVTPTAAGGSLVKLSGGSQWSVPHTCQLNVGDKLALSQPPVGKYGFQPITKGGQCNTEVEFVGSW